jgi:hypothetical protein
MHNLQLRNLYISSNTISEVVEICGRIRRMEEVTNMIQVSACEARRRDCFEDVGTDGEVTIISNICGYILHSWSIIDNGSNIWTILNATTYLQLSTDD